MTDTAPPRSRTRRWLAEIGSYALLILLVLGLHSLIAKPFYIPSESMMPTLLTGDRLIVSKYPYGWSWVSPSFHVLPFIRGRLLGKMPQRGDIVIVTPPDAGRRSEDLIKRVIGLPGDTVGLIGGRLQLNGKPIKAQDMGYRLLPIDGNFRCDAADPDPERAFPGYAGAQVNGRCRLHVIRETLPNGRSYDTLDFGPSGEDDFPLYRVPVGHLFLMGDNRDNSADSRVPTELNGLGGSVPIENIGGRAEFLTFSMNGTATWNPLSWFSALRAGRSGTTLRPD
jgi:signal peptidase I